MKILVRYALMFLLASNATFAATHRDFEMGGTAQLSSAIGIGTFVLGSGNMPSVSSTLNLSPYMNLPSVFGLPATTVSANLSLATSWIQPYNALTSKPGEMRLSDLIMSLSMPNALTLSPLKLSLTPTLNVVVPTSKSSLAWNRLMGVGMSLPVSLTTGDFSFSYIPLVTGFLYSQNTATVPCEGVTDVVGSGSVMNPNQPNFAIEDYVVSSFNFRESERLGDGRCMIRGRQTLAIIKNSLMGQWEKGSHRIQIMVGISNSFLRPLEASSKLTSENAWSPNTQAGTAAQILYQYKIPVEFSLFATAGIASQQSIYTPDGNIRFPFFDFTTPGNNYTEVFINMTVGI